MTETFLARAQVFDPALRYVLHTPVQTPKGAVLLTHGYGEHSDCYQEVVETLTNHGLLVATYDLRGHGQSVGRRGHIEKFEDYLRDADELLTFLETQPLWRQAGLPVLLGHSLGGLISFLVASANAGAVRGLVLSSPFFGFALHVPAPKKLAGQVLSRFMPTFALPSGVRGVDLTHDLVWAQRVDNDPLRIRKATARFYTETLMAQACAWEQAPRLYLPTLILQAGEDRIASRTATESLFKRIGSMDKNLRVAEGDYHEIFHENDRTRWINEAAAGALAFCQPVSGDKLTKKLPWFIL